MYGGVHGKEPDQKCLTKKHCYLLILNNSGSLVFLQPWAGAHPSDMPSRSWSLYKC